MFDLPADPCVIVSEFGMGVIVKSGFDEVVVNLTLTERVRLPFVP